MRVRQPRRARPRTADQDHRAVVGLIRQALSAKHHRLERRLVHQLPPLVRRRRQLRRRVQIVRAQHLAIVRQRLPPQPALARVLERDRELERVRARLEPRLDRRRRFVRADRFGQQGVGVGRLVSGATDRHRSLRELEERERRAQLRREVEIQFLWSREPCQRAGSDGLARHDRPRRAGRCRLRRRRPCSGAWYERATGRIRRRSAQTRFRAHRSQRVWHWRERATVP